MNNRVDNLEWLSAGDNQRHAYETGLKGRGEQHGRSKLKSENIEEIRDMIVAGFSNNAIAKEFGVTKGTIEGIKKGT